MERLRSLLTTNFHFTGVIIFFLLHGYRANRGLVPVADLLWLLALLLAGGFVVFGLSAWWFKNTRKAGIFTSCLLTIMLFFGAFQDFFSGFRLTAGISRLTWFLPVCLFAILVILIWLKRTKHTLQKPLLYINLLLLCYIVFEAGGLLLSKPGAATATNGRALVNTRERPSIYLILLDEYMGSDGLAGYFQYDNRWFDDSLKAKGFHVVAHSQSNYQLTLFSMASMLNMDYPADFGKAVIQDHYAYSNAMRRLRNNEVAALLAASGYRIANFSGFDLAADPAYYSTGLLPDKGRLLTSGTFWYRVAKYLPTFLVERGLMTSWEQKLEDQFVRNNEAAMKGTLKEAFLTDSVPVFTYLHLMMPHLPFAFDSSGHRTIGFHQREAIIPAEADAAYLQYLVYTNHRVLELVQQLKQATAGKAVILLMSDHGFRGAIRKDKKYGFTNVNAVYLPSQQYAAWYDGMSNVNQFRLLFNTLFQENLPILKDSLIR
ncbi:sulfatase-like hydrolase/transferase [Paraflavitalea sp. CAU 1676]|uniref:sulfatase-like hydrolase/transferase n=1 Tax=Paraflavitalea sp. CAU 1676 TaxID=3032598 RepID=UPI0023DC0555|nr:sulfatase-like hydrolase/transferase [Paraflavitalea sp. CAU 1676]MDF2187555.1 sulfatase-like hydrolase/transferase [Paraflavitalea sp. CAU 1676]